MTLVDKQGRIGTVRPFDESGVVRRPDGVLAYVETDQSLVAMLDRVRREHAGRDAVVEPGGERLTYAQLWDRACSVAGGLRAAGISRGDRVAISLVNGVGWISAFFGTVLAGGVVVPINFRLAPDEVDFILGDSGASVHIADPGGIPTGHPWYVDDLDRSELAAIFYTSGTTGRPKGAMTTHGNMTSINETSRRINGYRADEKLRSLLSVPLFHVTGCNAQLMPIMSLGGCTITLPRFDVPSYLDAVERYSANILVGVPAIYAQLLREPRFHEMDRSGLARVLYGGAPMAPEIIHQLRKLMPEARLGNGYGMTETASVSTRLPDELCDIRPETIGLATPVIELDVLDPNANGEGELMIRGENVVAGYWGRPDAWADTFRDGWLRTGDVCRIDEEGFCTLLDRRKDVIIRGGENVYSVEVENALIEHPDVLEVAVVAVPDDIMGERVGAVVVPRDGAAVTPNELLLAAADRIALFKLPEYLEIRSEPLPRNPGGKILKRELRDVDWGPRRRLTTGSSPESGGPS
jgi:acyl-CoA synthetase (AMP-forming)/AMP-acid ligase II